MSISTRHKPKPEAAVRASQPPRASDSPPNPEDGAQLVRAFVNIRSPERRQAVLAYAIAQAGMDKSLP